MRALARLIVAGPLQAVGVIALCTVLSLLAPPLTSVLTYVGAAALALQVLHAGVRPSLVVLLGAAVATALLGQLLLHEGVGILVAALLVWLPVWIAAVVLRMTLSLAMAILVLGGLAMLAVLLVYLVNGDPTPWWQQLLQGMVDSLLAAQPELKDAADSLSGFVERIAPLMTGLLAAGLGFAALACLLLGRWWQALLVKPGALRIEFYALRLNGALSAAGLAIMALASLKLGVLSGIAVQWSLIVMVMFFFVGLAVLHATLANLKAARIWLIAAYILMSLLPQALLTVVVIGLLDPWLDLRRRTTKAGSN
jgi:hypothetical protein